MVFTNKNNQIFESIFGNFDLKNKDFDVLSQQSIFLFINQMWSNILLNFKIHKVDISGGSTPKRHILQTVDFGLLRALINIFNEDKLINKIIYDSYKDPILSSSIPLDFYKNLFENEDILFKIKYKLINEWASSIKETTSGLEILDNNKEFKEIIFSNLKSSMDMLIIEIINGMNNDLKKDEIIKSKITSEINSLLFEKCRIEDIQNVSTRHMGNKEKKRFKKERTILLNNKENNGYYL